MPQSHITDQPTAPRGRDPEDLQPHDTKNITLSQIVTKLERILSTALQDILLFRELFMSFRVAVPVHYA